MQYASQAYACKLKLSGPLFEENKMNIDDFDFNEQDDLEAKALRESQLLADEVPLDYDANDCEACKI